MVNVTINFVFEDIISAESVGWYLSDPDYKCFRVGVAPGNYKSENVIVPLSLVGGVEYKFVVDVNAFDFPKGTYNVTSNNSTLAHNLIDGEFHNEEGTFFMTPKNVIVQKQ